MRPLITIDDFSYGIVQDPTIPAKNGFSFGVGIDINTDPGYLQASNEMVKDVESTVSSIGNVPYSIERYTELQDSSDLSQCDYYMLGEGINIYGKLKSSNPSTRWYKLHTVNDSTGRGDIKGFGGTLYYASKNYLGRCLLRTLTLAATIDTTEIHLNSLEDFPQTGTTTIVVGKEVITYTGADPNGYLTGCARGSNGTFPATHSIGDVVMGFHDTFKSFKAGDGLYHPMAEFLGKLNVGDGRYIATIDGDQTFDDDALILPEGIRISTTKVYGDKLNLGTFKGDTFYDYPEGQLFTWDGVSEFPNQNFDFKDGGISALEPWKNNLIIFGGAKGNIYQSDGASVIKLKTVPRITSTGYAQVYPNAVGVVGGDLHFGLSGNRNDCVPGIYSLGQKQSGDPISLTLKHVTASGILGASDTELQILSVFPYSYSNFYTGIYDTNADDQYQINYLGTNKLNGAYVESQVYEIPRENQNRLLRGEEVMVDNTDGTVSIKYKLDHASSWSTLGEIDYQNQLFKGIDQRAKSTQTRLELETTGTTSPKIKNVKIY